MDKAAHLEALLKEHPYVLAPMAGVCDVTFRSLCVEQGAGLAYTEMVSAKGLSYHNVKTARLLEIGEKEERVVVQLFGHEPEVMAQVAATLEESLGERLVAIDVNMGCPVRKVVSKGEGSALMHTPDLAAEIVAAMDKATVLPITAKIRKGVSFDEDLCVDVALRLQEAGAAAVAVHGRTAAQFYSGRADWEAIARVADALSIPVIGNGDVESLDQADAYLESIPGLAAVMIGRAARANPFLFSRSAPTLDQRVELARNHALGLETQGQLLRMRKFISWYLHGVPNATVIRRRANECSTIQDFLELLDAIPSLVEGE